MDNVAMAFGSQGNMPNPPKDWSNGSHLPMAAMMADTALVGIFSGGLFTIFPRMAHHKDNCHENGNKQGKPDCWV
ncbi:hypothetical protein GCM10007867_23820 [Gluconobacter cerinus]|uniref:Uncharacterized protein n=1 Tax=Gluconobacter cerinus TaxID=38307 RepID=A0AAV5NGJ9_9PROT|nr:hypothetical protein GCM10007867_23820 [Gluconobacter cerinus]